MIGYKRPDLGRRPPGSLSGVLVPDGYWSQMVIVEMELFPKGRYDDLIECAVRRGQSQPQRPALNLITRSTTARLFCYR
jgi:hypothetical protein